MAQLALTVAGSFVPGIGPLAAFVGGTIGGYIDRKWLLPNDRKRPGPDIDAIQVQTSTYGTGIPVLYGIMRIAGNVIWCDKIRKEIENEGKANEKVHLYASFAVGICAGPISEIIEIYANGQRLASYRSTSGIRRFWTDDNTELDAILTYRIYRGTEEQEPDPLISQKEGATNTPAHRGLAYMVFEDFPIDQTGDAIPNLTFEVAQSLQGVVPFEPIDIGSYLSQVWSYSTPNFATSTVEIADIDGDGNNELVFVTYDNRIYVLNNNGTVRNSYAVGSGNAWGHVCCVDVNNDGKKEIIWGSFDGRVRCMSHNLASTLWVVENWFTRHGVTPPFYFDVYYKYGPTFATRDVSGTPTLCIFLAGRDGVLTCVRASDGTVLWEHNTNVGNPITGNSDIYYSPTIKDVDLDGQPEIVIGTSLGQCMLVEHTGGTHYPVPPDVPTWDFTGSGSSSSDFNTTGIAIGDVNGDERDEIVLTGGHQDPEDGRISAVWVLDRDGSQLSFLTLRLGASFSGLPVIHDPEGTGYKVIFLTDSQGYVTCIQVSHALGAPMNVKWDTLVSGSSIECGPSVIDVDGDGIKEVVIGIAEGYVVVLDPETGEEKQRIPVYPPTTIEGTITGGDIDGDGYVELLVPLRAGKKIVCLRGGPTHPGNWFRRWGITNNRASEVIDYDPDGGVHRDRDLAAQDNLAVDGSAFRNRIFIESSGVWNVWDMLRHEIMMTFDARANGIQAMPASAGSDFDTAYDDPYGHVIYTSKAHDITGIGYIVKLDGDTMAILDDTASTSLFSTPVIVRASKNSSAPWIVVIEGDGSKAYVMDKRTLRFGGSYYYTVNPANANYKWKSAFVDGEGLIWLISHRADNGWAKLRRLQVSTDFVVTPQEVDVAPTVYYPSLVTVDDATNQVLVGTTNLGGKIAFYDRTALTLLGTLVGEVIGAYPKSAWQNGPNRTGNGRFYYTYGTDTIHAIDLVTRMIAETWTVNPSPGGWAGGCVPALASTLVAGVAGSGFSYAWVKYNRADPLAIPISDVVWDICERCDMTVNTDFDPFDLTDEIWGYLLDNRMSAKDAIQPLAEIFFFDGIEENGVLNFRKRGGSSVATIPRAHLASHLTEDARPQEMEVARSRGLSLASRVEVVFVDYDANYEQGTQRVFREGSQSTEVLAVNAPVAIDGTTAKRIAYRTLGLIWIGRTQRKLFLPRDWCWLSPSDVVTVETEDGDIVVRIDKIDMTGGLLSLDVTEEDQEIYDTSVVAAKPTLPDFSFASPGLTYLQLVDCALLSGLDDKPGIYVAATGSDSNWRGAELLVSRDGGASWNSWGSVSRRATIGKVATALPDCPDLGVMDRSSTLVVRLLTSSLTLESVTTEELMACGNMAIVGSEVVQFASADRLSDGSYLLRDFIRGRRGTEWAMGSHSVGEYFMLVDGLVFHEMSLEDKSVDLRIKAVSFGTFETADKGKPIRPAFRNLQPLAPCGASGARDLAGDLTISWTRRTRLAGEWQDDADVPLAETSEAYEVDILVGGAVMRTIATPVPSCLYTAAQQAADAITPGAPVAVRIYQMSTAVGRGFPASATV